MKCIFGKRYCKLGSLVFFLYSAINIRQTKFQFSRSLHRMGRNLRFVKLINFCLFLISSIPPSASIFGSYSAHCSCSRRSAERLIQLIRQHRNCQHESLDSMMAFVGTPDSKCHRISVQIIMRGKFIRTTVAVRQTEALPMNIKQRTA